MSKIRVSVLGATGYTGFELVKLMLMHPGIEIAHLTSESTPGKPYSELYPALLGRCDKRLSPNDIELVAKDSDAAFLCLPHGASMDAAAALADRGLKVFDLSADYRINDAKLYEKTYNLEHKHTEWLAKAVYGLAEIFTEEIKQADLVAVPGCYPTSILIPLIPLLKDGLIDTRFIIADSKSGVSGSGKKATLTTHYCEAHEDFKPYAIMSHRHRPEIDHIIGRAAGKSTRVTFTPHLVPMNRGMISTIYTAASVEKEELMAAWHKAYADKPFVRMREDGSIPSAKYVANTPFIDIALYMDKKEAGPQIIIVSAIDNLMKGASSQAMQCFNLRIGFEETACLSI